MSKWKGKDLSTAGHELLIKVVTQTLPAYAMNCFLLPRTFWDDLHKLMAWFWWGVIRMKDTLVVLGKALRRMEEWIFGTYLHLI